MKPSGGTRRGGAGGHSWGAWVTAPPPSSYYPEDTGRRLERLQGEGLKNTGRQGWKGYMKKVEKDTWRRLERIQREGLKGYREKVGKDIRKRLERIQREGWKGYKEKVGKDTGEKLERTKGEVWL